MGRERRMGRLAEHSFEYLWAILRGLGVWKLREAPYICHLPFSCFPVPSLLEITRQGLIPDHAAWS